MQAEKYLPIGTVVMLKGGKKRAMIIGFCCSNNGDTSKIYDYAGCLYPEGTLSSDKIDKIYYLGLSDEEEKNFKTRLNQFLVEINN